MKQNGWNLFIHKLFKNILDRLKNEVIKVKSNDINYKNHPKYKLLAKIRELIVYTIPGDPLHPRYILTNDLKEWRRVRFRRYRMFFKIFSDKKSLIYIWINNEKCLRKEGSKSDVYSVFKNMVKGKKFNPDYYHLIAESKALENEAYID
jgi:toxin YhaV